MSDLLETVIEAHGGLERWNQLDTVSARLPRAEPSGRSRARTESSTMSSSRRACTKSERPTAHWRGRPTQLIHPRTRRDRDR